VFPRGFVDPSRRVPCLDRLRSVLGFAPARSIASIVAELLAPERAPLPALGR
jgi:hypothetical protein